LASLGRVRVADRQGGPEIYWETDEGRRYGEDKNQDSYFFSGFLADESTVSAGRSLKTAQQQLGIRMFNGQDETDASRPFPSKSLISRYDSPFDDELESVSEFDGQPFVFAPEPMSKTQAFSTRSRSRLSLIDTSKKETLSLFDADGNAETFYTGDVCFLGRAYRDGGFGGRGRHNNYTNWLNQLAPALAPTPAKPKPIESKWNGDVNRVMKTLLQSIDLDETLVGIASRAVQRTLS